MFIYHSLSKDAAFNMALEEYLLLQQQDDHFLLFWQSDNTILIGRHQNTVEEINATFVEENNVAVVRRLSGGGAIYQDLGCINFSFITPLHNALKNAMEQFTKPVIAALSDLGVMAIASGRNDIIVGEKKVCGNAEANIGKCILHHGSLLYDADISLIANALTVRQEKFQSKSAKSVRSRIGNICDFMPTPLSREEFIQYLMSSLSKKGQYKPLVLQEKDWKEVSKLKTEKYDSWEWTYGKSPNFTIKNTRKFPGGFIDVRLLVSAGIIKECKIYGDFMSLKPIDEIIPLLIGKRFIYKEVESILLSINLSEYLGTITREEILRCFFSNETDNT